MPCEPGFCPHCVLAGAITTVTNLTAGPVLSAAAEPPSEPKLSRPPSLTMGGRSVSQSEHQEMKEKTPLLEAVEPSEYKYISFHNEFIFCGFFLIIGL